MLQKIPKSQIAFGTDGMRGRADEFDISGIKRMGYEIAQQLPEGSTYIIGRDTRQSGIKFQQALQDGIESANKKIVVEDAGIIPTPLTSYIIAQGGESIQGGVMITASHNPSFDNGFKVFDKEGKKIPKMLEDELKIAYDNTNLVLPSTQLRTTNNNKKSDVLTQQYIIQLRNKLEKSQLSGSIAIDCANGATFEVAKNIFQPTRKGLEFELFANEPNGDNINENCGITNPQFLEQILQRKNHQLGISFDGDGDRVGFTDERGKYIDGDFVIAYLATKLKEEGKLKDNTIVVTQYSNLALEDYLCQHNIKTHRVENGDKAIMQQMRKKDWNFGAERTGHIILDTTVGCGDGIRAAVEVLKYLDSRILVSEQLNHLYMPNPQIQKNIQLQSKISSLNDLNKNTQYVIEQATQEVEERGGRLLVRPSGTEPKLRALVESSNEELNQKIMNTIIQLF